MTIQEGYKFCIANNAYYEDETTTYKMETGETLLGANGRMLNCDKSSQTVRL